MDEIAFSTTPNDAYFKTVFADPERAALFFQAHLEPSLVALVDWSSMVLQPGSYVDKSLAKSESDLVFRARMDGRDLVLYLLFEHQSTVDSTMPLRLLGYILRILQKSEEQTGLPLPVVLPFVLHQGPEKWTVSPQFRDLFGLSGEQAAAFGGYLPDFRHALLDLTELDPKVEEHHDQLKLVLELMKLARVKRVAEFLQWLREGLADASINVPESLLLLSFVYVLHVDEVIDVEAIADTLATQPQTQNTVMTLAQRLIAQGEARGEARGQAMGEVRGKIKVLESLMAVERTRDEVLSAMSLDQLNQRFAQLEKEYRLKFK